MDAKQSIAIIGINSILAQSIYDKLSGDFEIVQVYHVNKDKVKSAINLISTTDFLKMDRSFKAIYFISAAINYQENSSNVQQVFDANVKFLLEVSERFLEAKIIHSSTVSIYEELGQTVTEMSNISPKNSYATSKLWAEQIVSRHPGGGVNVRMSSLFGVQMNQTTFLPKVIRNAIQNKEINIFGDGSRKQNYISADEAGEYFCNAMNYTGKLPLLAVAGQSFSNIEVAEIIKENVDGVSINFKGEDNSKSFVYDNTATREALQMNTKHSFSDLLIQLISWIEKQP